MKTSHLVNVLLALTVVSLPMERAVSAELSHVTANQLTASLANSPRQTKDGDNMKDLQKGGSQAEGFQLAGTLSPETIQPLSDGMTTIQIGNTMGYVDASGRFSGLANP